MFFGRTTPPDFFKNIVFGKKEDGKPGGQQQQPGPGPSPDKNPNRPQMNPNPTTSTNSQGSGPVDMFGGLGVKTKTTKKGFDPFNIDSTQGQHNQQFGQNQPQNNPPTYYHPEIQNTTYQTDDQSQQMNMGGMTQSTQISEDGSNQPTKSKGPSFGKFKNKEKQPEPQPTMISNVGAFEDTSYKGQNDSSEPSTNFDYRSEGVSETGGDGFGGPKRGGFDPFSMGQPTHKVDGFPPIGTHSKTDVDQSDTKSDKFSDTMSEKKTTGGGGPSFGKFKKKPEQQQPVHIDDLASIPSRDDSSYYGGDREYREEPRREVPAYTPQKPEKSLLPQPIQPPIFDENETPEYMNMRLEKRRNDNLEKIGDLLVRQNQMMSKKNSLDGDRETITKKLQVVTRQQEQAIEQDQFEHADELEVVITQLKETLQNLGRESDNCQMAYTELEKEKQILYQQNHMLYKEYITIIDKLALTYHHHYEKYKLECINQQNNEKAYIEEESQRLQLYRNHIELDLKHIEEESAQVSESLQSKTKDYVSEQDKLLNKKNELETLIDEIRKELAAKEKELSEVNRNLDSVTGSINKIRSKFDDSLKKIEVKRDKVGADEKAFEVDSQKLNKYKENNEHNSMIFDDNMKRAQKMFETYEQMKNRYFERSTTLHEENAKREETLERYYQALNELNQSKAQLTEIYQEIEKLKTASTQRQNEISDLFQQKNTLDAKLPILEKEKKGYASSRNFKEASRVTNESKEIQTRIDEITSQLEQLQAEEKTSAQAISTHEQKTIPGLEKTMKNNEEVSDINKYYFLLIREKDLKELLAHYNEQKQYEETNLIEAELGDAQYQIQLLVNKYPHLGTHIDYPETTQYQHHHHEEEHKTEEPTEEVQHQEEKVPTQNEIPQEETQKETTPEPEVPQLSLEEYIAEYDKADAEIKELDTKIDQLASEEKYEEADEASAKQDEFKTRRDEVLNRLRELGYESIEQAKEASGNKEETQETQEIQENQGEENNENQE